jgi:hypothetical protein
MLPSIRYGENKDNASAMLERRKKALERCIHLVINRTRAYPDTQYARSSHVPSSEEAQSSSRWDPSPIPLCRRGSLHPKYRAVLEQRVKGSVVVRS